MQIEHRKNTAYYLAFAMLDTAAPESFKSGVSPVDSAYYKDGAGSWTSLSIADTAAEIASTGVYEIDLTASEMNHDQFLIKFSVSGASATAFLFALRTDLAEDVQTDLSNSTDGLGALKTLITTAQTDLTQIKADLPTSITKNKALGNFPFLMVESSDSVTPATGLSITATRSIDGSAFAACANGATELSNGWYKISLAATDLNGDTIALRFAASTANDQNITIVTQP